MEKFFKLRENNTNVKTEVVAGVTTFFAMAYIIFVQPTYLSAAGMDANAVMLATCISSALGCFLTALLANVPFAQAPGMGLNAFFTYTVCFGMGYTWQQALTIVLLSGVLFLIIAVSPIRSKIIESIPAFMKSAIGAGIGLFIALIGMLNADIVKFYGDTIVDGVVVATDYSGLGNVLNPTTLLAIIGLLITGVLMAWKIKGAIFIGIIVSTIIGIPMGVTTIPENFTMTASLAPTFCKLDFGGLLSHGFLPLFTAVISFALVDCFDTVGTLIGTATNAGMVDENGNLPGGDRALIADAIATCAGAFLGTLGNLLDSHNDGVLIVFGGGDCGGCGGNINTIYGFGNDAVAFSSQSLHGQCGKDHAHYQNHCEHSSNILCHISFSSQNLRI